MANLLTTSFPTRFGRKHCLHILIIWLGLRTQQKKQQRNIGTVSRIEYDRITAYVQTSRSLRKHPTFPKKTTGFLAKQQDIPYRYSILLTCHYTDLGSASYWLKQNFNHSETLPRSWSWHVISIEFLFLFLRHLNFFCSLGLRDKDSHR